MPPATEPAATPAETGREPPRGAQRELLSLVTARVGDTPLRIERVELTPPLRLTGMRAQVGPGDTATLRLSLNPDGLSGRFAGRVVAHTNDPGAREIVLSVVGDVVRPIAQVDVCH